MTDGTASPAGWAAALDWWREAGVDCAFADAPRRWLKPAEGVPAQAGTAGGSAEGLRSSPARGLELHLDLAAFRAWWLAEPSLDGGRTDHRVPPRGSQGAALMIVVAEPEAEDRDSLLSGPQGRLLEAFLKAAGIAPDGVYLASAIPRHLPHVDWGAVGDAGLGEALAHHVTLVGPRRLMALGSSILPLLGHDPAQNDQPLPRFNHGGLSVPLFCGRGLATLLAKPAWKASFWRRWLDWSALADAAET